MTNCNISEVNIHTVCHIAMDEVKDFFRSRVETLQSQFIKIVVIIELARKLLDSPKKDD